MYQTHSVSRVEEEKNRPSCFDNQRDSLGTTHYPWILHGNTTFTLDLSRDLCAKSARKIMVVNH